MMLIVINVSLMRAREQQSWVQRMADPEHTGRMMKKELVLALEIYQQYMHQHKSESCDSLRD